MGTKAVDVINIVLIIISCILAYILPFELFLFSYAVLGPLHYLTEISWLHKNRYYTNSENDYLILLGCALALVAASYLVKLPHLNSFIVFVAISFALASVVFNTLNKKIIFLLIASTAAFFVKLKVPSAFILIGLFIPTIIHVFVFTGLFIFYGALKKKSLGGFVTVAIFILSALSFFFFSPQTTYQATDYARHALDKSGFLTMNMWFANIFHLGSLSSANVFDASPALQIMRFVAFAYTYHYLNWFSKTEVIKWHKVPRKQLVLICLLWVVSVSIYAYNFKTGLVALYILSILHVILEFPLNFRTMIGVRSELNKKLTTSRSRLLAFRN